MFRDTDIKSREKETDFWSSLCQLSPNDAIYSGLLFERSSSGVLKERSFELTSHYLVKNKPNISGLSKRSLLIWKPVRPFVENSCIYGFRIGHIDCYRDFYAESKEKFSEWLKFLSCAGIMTSIEDDFHFFKKIGKDKIGTFFLAEDKDTHIKYTIKFIKQNRFDVSLINEINIMRTINHPNAVKLHRVYESDAGIYIVFDSLSEIDLFQKIVDVKQLPEKDCIIFAKKIMELLDYFSSQNIIHRNIKLENISIANGLDFKLYDFSMATFVKNDTNTRCGSLGYIAPEILKKENYGLKADIFSAGVVLYILSVGKMPFYGKSQKEILLRNREALVYFPENLCSRLSRKWIRFLCKILDPNPNSRISAGEALKEASDMLFSYQSSN